jgi:hypothetical protein
LVCLFAFGVGGAAGSSFFELSMEGEAVFMLSRAWFTASLLDEGKIDCSLVEGNGSQYKACNGTNIGVGVLVGLTGLVVRVEGLINGRGQ